MENLEHTGVLGMKWGIRKAEKRNQQYRYRSGATRRWERRENDTGKVEQYRKVSGVYAKRSRELDRAMQAYAKKISVGGAIVKNILMTPWGHKRYATARALNYGRIRSTIHAYGGLLNPFFWNDKFKQTYIKDAKDALYYKH